MAHAQVLEAYINIALMYMLCHILLVLTINDLINEDGKPTTPFKLATGTKTSISHLRVLFFPFSVLKATAHVGKKAFKKCHHI